MRPSGGGRRFWRRSCRRSRRPRRLLTACMRQNATPQLHSQSSRCVLDASPCHLIVWSLIGWSPAGGPRCVRWTSLKTTPLLIFAASVRRTVASTARQHACSGHGSNAPPPSSYRRLLGNLPLLAVTSDRAWPQGRLDAAVQQRIAEGAAAAQDLSSVRAELDAAQVAALEADAAVAELRGGLDAAQAREQEQQRLLCAMQVRHERGTAALIAPSTCAMTLVCEGPLLMTGWVEMERR